MDIFSRLTLFSYVDYSAFGLLLLLWFVIGWRIEHPSTKHASVSVLMAKLPARMDAANDYP